MFKMGYKIELYTAKARIVYYLDNADCYLMDRMEDMLNKQLDSKYLSDYYVQFGGFSPEYFGQVFIQK